MEMILIRNVGFLLFSCAISFFIFFVFSILKREKKELLISAVYGIAIAAIGSFTKTNFLFCLLGCVLAGLVYWRLRYQEENLVGLTYGRLRRQEDKSEIPTFSFWALKYPQENKIRFFASTLLFWFILTRFILLALFGITLNTVHVLLAVPFILGVLIGKMMISEIFVFFVDGAMIATTVFFGIMTTLGLGWMNAALWCLFFSLGIFFAEGTLDDSLSSLHYALVAVFVGLVMSLIFSEPVSAIIKKYYGLFWLWYRF